MPDTFNNSPVPGYQSSTDSLRVAVVSGAGSAATATIATVATNATGANWQAFASAACTSMDIVNSASAAVDIEYRRGGSGSSIVIPAGTARAIIAIENADEIEVRRVDQSNTTVTISAELFT